MSDGLGRKLRIPKGPTTAEIERMGERIGEWGTPN